MKPLKVTIKTKNQRPMSHGYSYIRSGESFYLPPFKFLSSLFFLTMHNLWLVYLGSLDPASFLFFKQCK